MPISNPKQLYDYINSFSGGEKDDAISRLNSKGRKAYFQYGYNVGDFTEQNLKPKALSYVNTKNAKSYNDLDAQRLTALKTVPKGKQISPSPANMGISNNGIPINVDAQGFAKSVLAVPKAIDRGTNVAINTLNQTSDNLVNSAKLTPQQKKNYTNKNNKPLPVNDTGSKILNKVADIGGEIGSTAILPGAGSNTLMGLGAKSATAAERVAAKTGSKILSKAAQGAAFGGVTTAAQDTLQGKKLKQTAKDVAINTAAGAVADLGLAGLSKIVSRITKNAAKVGVEKAIAQENLTPQQEVQVKQVLLNGNKFAVRPKSVDVANNNLNNNISKISNYYGTNNIMDGIKKVNSTRPTNVILNMFDNNTLTKTQANKFLSKVENRTNLSPDDFIALQLTHPDLINKYKITDPNKPIDINRRIQQDTGINLNSTFNAVDKANKQNINTITNRQNMAYVAGVKNKPNVKLINPYQTSTTNNNVLGNTVLSNKDNIMSYDEFVKNHAGRGYTANDYKHYYNAKTLPPMTFDEFKSKSKSSYDYDGDGRVIVDGKEYSAGWGDNASIENAYQNYINQYKSFNSMDSKTAPKAATAVNSGKQPNIFAALQNKPMQATTGALGKEKTSKFYSNSLMKGNVLTPQAKQQLDEINYIYNEKPNATSLERAQQQLNKNGIDNEINRLKSNGLNSAEDSMGHYLVTSKLMEEAKKTGDYTKLNDYLKTTRPSITNVGQTIQALSQFKKSTPEGALLTAHSVVENATKALEKTNPKLLNKANSELANINTANIDEFNKAKDKIFKKYNIPELSNDDAKFITDTMTKAQSMPEGRAKDVEIAKVMQRIGDKVPVSMAEKVKGLQRISMLLNPKTQVRNVLGNVILGGLETPKDIIGTPIDYLTSKVTGKRTTTLPNLGIQAKGMLKGAGEALQDARLGIDTSASRGQYEVPQGRIFKNRALNALDQINKAGLSLGDRPFYQGAYDDRIAQLKKLNKTDTITQDMADEAKRYAEDRTFQNDSKIAVGFKMLQKGLNNITGNENFGLGNVVIPFTKTPANILDKAVDYSPGGLIKAVNQLKNAATKGTFDQKRFVDSVARGTTGTGLIMLGYDLAKKGYLNGGANDNKDVAALEKQMGKSPYSIKVGDTYHTIDWMQPSAIPLMIGADIYKGGKDRKAASSIVMDAVKSGGTTLFKQSLLQGVQRMFGGYDPMQGLADTLLNIPTQFVPTAAKQFEQLGDNTTRNTYDPSKVQQMLNQIKTKIPGQGDKLQPKIDTLGREVKNYQGDNSLFNIFLNPGYTTKEQSTPGEKLVYDIYNKTGQTIQFPRVAPTSNKGTPYTAQQVTDLQREMGQQANIFLNRLANTPEFLKIDPNRQAKFIQGQLTDIEKRAKTKVLPPLPSKRK